MGFVKMLPTFTEIREVFADAFLRSDLRLSRLTVAIGSLTWASILLLGANQFDRPSYVHLSSVAPQWAYGAIFGICGLAQLFRALKSVPITSGPLACIVAGVIAWLWLSVCIGLGMSLDPPPGMLAGNIAICLLSGLIFFRTVSKRG